MNCPECGKPMRKGYLQGARGVIFCEYEKVLFVVKNPFSKKDKTIVSAWTGCASPAYYCDDCDCMVWKKDLAE